jgi:Family of unknown function (DUF6893)
MQKGDGMKKVFCTAASVGLVVLLVAMAPDIKRYLRMRFM